MPLHNYNKRHDNSSKINKKALKLPLLSLLNPIKRQSRTLRVNRDNTYVTKIEGERAELFLKICKLVFTTKATIPFNPQILLKIVRFFFNILNSITIIIRS